MIAYTMVGTGDLEKAQAFYEPLFAEVNLEVCWKDESCFSYGRAQDLNFPRFMVGYPFDGNSSSVGNGVMTAFQLHDPEVVDRLYKIAMPCGR
ncbi:MAG: VOC family protein [Halomonas sp.]|nr:VOC family protein [Halomonas sp.]MCC5903769.1 VOC family protein [Halomonas sp.]